MEIMLKAYREGKRWFVDDDNGFSKDDNELVAGIPEIIAAVVGPRASRVAIRASDTPIAGAWEFRLLGDHTAGGVDYEVTVHGQAMQGWLCKVFWHYFDAAPSRLYVALSAD
jgi:hypothetical protein